MILHQILDHDLHRARQIGPRPLFVWQAAPPICREPDSKWIVSNATGQFLATSAILEDGRIRSGVFVWDPDKIDGIIPLMMEAAYKLSVDKKWPNVFQGKNSASKGFQYIEAQSGMVGQPHVCLVPDSWDASKLKGFFGKDLAESKYQKYCRVASTKIEFPVFCSRPDMVGMYTQIMGGKSSILLHNVKLGLAFCTE
jgi:hypothetical protein